MSYPGPLDYAYPVAPGAVSYWQPGMTRRDYFAAQALPAVIAACFNGTLPPGQKIEELFAEKAYAIADAMLKESPP